MQIAILGLGKMGSRIAKKLLASENSVIVWNRSAQAVTDFVATLTDKEKEYVTIASSLTHVSSSFTKQKIIWSMLPAGEPTKAVLGKIFHFTSEGDIVIDGGNAQYQDSQKWFEKFAKKKVQFLGIGVSGGILAAEKGFALMVGGDKKAYESVLPILQTLAAPSGNVAYVGLGGAGHFVKMVHNGIEYGMMQAIGEGFGVLEKSPYNFNLPQIAKLYAQGTIIQSFLIDRTADALVKDPSLSTIDGVIDASGEALWTIRAAKKEQVPVPVIKKSLSFRSESHKTKAIASSFAARLIAAIRHEFGGHKVMEK